MLAWALAFSDRDLAPAERDMLAAMARLFSISPERAAELKHLAQLFLIGQALDGAYQDGQLDAAAHAEVMALTRDLGLSAEEAERIDALHAKRGRR
jgi:hypothetical protein